MAQTTKWQPARICVEDDCGNEAVPGQFFCSQCIRFAARRYEGVEPSFAQRVVETVRETVFLLVAIAALLMLPGCGSETEPETHAAPPRPETVAVVEVCTVTFMEGGEIRCDCEVAP